MGAAGVGAGLGIMGGILGGVGDIVSAANYQRPQLRDPKFQERQLRQLAQHQLEGGGQQLLGATSLYNSMAPMLMGMLPGMSYVPGTPGTGDAASAGGMGSGSGGGLDSYQSALAALQARQAASARLGDLRRQRKQAKGPEKRAYKDQIKAAKTELRGHRRAGQLGQDMYRAGTTAPSELYNVSRGTAPTGMGPGTNTGATLALIRGLMAGGQGRPPDMGG